MEQNRMANKLKIMHVLGAKSSGGAELFFIRLMVALKDKCDLLCVVREGSWAQKQLEEAGVSYKTLPFGGFFDFKTKCALKKIIRDFKPDVVQGWMNRACKALPKTSAVNVGRLGGYYALKNYKNCDHLVGNTEGIRDYLIEQGFGENNSHYIPNFSPAVGVSYKKQAEKARTEYNIPQGAKVLFLAGRLHAVKAIDVAIKALAKLPNHVHLVIGGTGALQGELESLAESLEVAERVHFLGWVSNLPYVVSMADVWLAPSRYEPLGNFVLDAWAMKVPLVAAKSAGPLSLVKDGETGMLVAIDDVEDTANAIQVVLENEVLAHKLVEQGAEFFDKNFSENVVVKQYLDFYKQIIKGR